MAASPYQIVDEKFQVTVGINRKCSSSNWYKIKEASYSVAAVCLGRIRKGGKAVGIGKTWAILSIRFKVYQVNNLEASGRKYSVNSQPEKALGMSLYGASRCSTFSK